MLFTHRVLIVRYISTIHYTLSYILYTICYLIHLIHYIRIRIYYTHYRYSKYSKESNHTRPLIRIISRKKCTYTTSYNRSLRVHFRACPTNGPERELTVVIYTRNENPPFYNAHTIYEFRSRRRGWCR